MKLTLEISSEPDLKWNDRLKTSPYGTIYHTSEMGISKTVRNQQALFFKFINNSGEIVAQQLALSFNRHKLNNFTVKVFKKIIPVKILQWNYGPVIFNPNYTDQIMIELRKYILKNNFKIQGTEHPFSDNIFSNFKKPFILNEKCTFIINLEDDLESIWNNMNKHSVQKNIKRSKKRGVYIREMDKSSYLKYRQLSIKIGKDTMLSSKNIERQWELLSSVGYTGFLAFLDEEIIGGITISFFNNYVNEFNIVRTNQDYEKKLYSQDLLKWKIIEWAKNKKCKYFDFSGANPHPLNSKEEGILRYKKKWGGVQKNYLQIIR